MIEPQVTGEQHGSRISAIVCLVISVATFGIGPFLQQAIQNVPCDYTVSAAGSIPVSNFIRSNESFYRSDINRYQLDPDTQYLITQGFTPNDGYVPKVTQNVQCSTANCSFPIYGGNITHSSLAVCSSCFDTSSYITMSNSTDDGSNFPPPIASLPNGQTVANYTEGQILWLTTGITQDRNSWPISIADDRFKSIATEEYAITILSVTRDLRYPLLYGPGSENKSYAFSAVAVSCTLYPCVQNYFGQIKSGTFHETSVSSSPLSFLGSSSTAIYPGGSALLAQSPCLASDGKIYSTDNFTSYRGSDAVVLPMPGGRGQNMSVPTDCVYVMDPSYVNALYWYFMSMFNNGVDTSCAKDTTSDQLNCDGSPWLAPLAGKNFSASAESITAVIANVATAATTVIRLSGKNASTGGGFDSTEGNFYRVKDFDAARAGLVLGSGTQITVCYKIQWPWVAFPVAMVLVVLVLLCYSVFSTYGRRKRGLPVWKSSVLPLLFYGLRGPLAVTEAEEEARGGGTERRAIEERAKRIVVQLVSGEDECGLLVTERKRKEEAGGYKDRNGRNSVDTDVWQRQILDLRQG